MTAFEDIGIVLKIMGASAVGTAGILFSFFAIPVALLLIGKFIWKSTKK